MEKLLTFPGLGLEFHLNPILLPITDGFGVHWYGVIIAVGFLLAVLWCCRQSAGFGIKQDDVIDLLFFAVPLGIIGARLYYVVFRWEDYDSLVQIVRIWDGGLAIYGGIIASVLTVLVFSKVRKLNFWAFADLGCMGLFIGQCVGRWGNFVNVEAFGSVTDVPWRMAGPDVAAYLSWTGQIDAETYDQIVNGTLGVHPTFFYESLWTLAGFLLLAFVVKDRRRFDGQMFACYAAWYGVGRFFIEGLRTDSLGLGDVRVSQVLAAVSAVVSVGIMAYVLAVKKPSPEGLYVHRLERLAEAGRVGETQEEAAEGPRESGGPARPEPPDGEEETR